MIRTHCQKYNTGRSDFNMKAPQLYEELKHLAEKLDITVAEHSFKATGTRARSGLCKVHERWYFIMDKNRRLSEKIDLLSECLGSLDTEAVFVVPTVRELLQKKGAAGGPDGTETERAVKIS
jgi:hypothetical protein